jgi:hypothetical protein
VLFVLNFLDLFAGLGCVDVGREFDVFEFLLDLRLPPLRRLDNVLVGFE